MIVSAEHERQPRSGNGWPRSGIRDSRAAATGNRVAAVDMTCAIAFAMTGGGRPQRGGTRQGAPIV